LFDEAGYLRLYPGLRDAIAAGIVESGWDHYEKHGRREGRQPNDVDPDFYLASYAIVAADLGRPPRRGDAAGHFIRLGRARGYLPNAKAPRPDDPSAIASRFGGLWTDRPDALDMIQNRFDLGRITDKQAERLRTWIRDGYVTIDLGTGTDRLAPAALALDQTFAGIIPAARFRCPALGDGLLPWTPELTPLPAAALDIHHLSGAIRSLILAPIVTRFLTELFDSPLRVTGTEGLLRPIARAPHQDSSRAGHTSQRGFAGVWFGLDDPVAVEAMYVYPGSHRQSEFLYRDRFKSAEEARRIGEDIVAADEDRHAEHLMTVIRRRGLARTSLAPQFGSAIVWHPDLIRESVSPAGLDVCRGLRVIVCPRTVAPLYAERAPTIPHAHGGHHFDSGVYAEQEPVD
jgi:hypothetical protein